MRAVGADEVERPDDPERLLGGRRSGLPGAAAPALLVLALLLGIGATVSDRGDVEAAAVLAVAAAWCGLVGVLVAGAWWALASRGPRRPADVVRPDGGDRPAWRSHAGCAAVGGRVVLWDGEGRHRLLPLRGRGAPAGVAAAPDAVVLVDAYGDAFLRLPAPHWGAPSVVAARVAAATDLPLLRGRAPSGGEDLVDPPPRSSALAVTARLLAVAAVLPALVGGLWVEGRRQPVPWAWVPAATAVGLALLAVAGIVAVRGWRARGRTPEPGARRRSAALATWFPTAAAAALVASPMTYVTALPDGATAVWLGVLTTASLVVALVAVVVPSGIAHRAPGLAVTGFAVVVAVASRESLTGRALLAVLVLAGGSAVVCAAGVAGAVRGRSLPRP